MTRGTVPGDLHHPVNIHPETLPSVHSEAVQQAPVQGSGHPAPSVTATPGATVSGPVAPAAAPLPRTATAPSATPSPAPRSGSKSIGFKDGLGNWKIDIGGGSDLGKGSVRHGSAILREGDSFLVSLERDFLVPDNPAPLVFTFTELNWDTTDQNSVKDAFEASLLDDAGHTLVHSFSPERDAFFNIGEVSPAALGTAAMITGAAVQTVTLDLSAVRTGTDAHIQFRLVNNDHDTQTSVRILDVTVPTNDAPPAATIALQNDTAPDGPGTDAYRSDLLTNDPRVTGTATDDHGVSKLEAQADGGGFTDITAALVNGQYSFDPGTLPPGAHQITVRATDSAGQSTDALLNFTVNTPPVAKARVDKAIDEGGTAFFDASGSSDADGRLFAYQWTFGDGTTATGPAASKSYPQDGNYPVTLSVTDTGGSIATDLIQVIVHNLAPVVPPLAGIQAGEGDQASLETSFTDAGVLDMHTATVDWGDGSRSTATVTESAGSGTVAATHVYADNGAYTVSLQVQDRDGGSAGRTAAATIANVAPAVTPAATSTAVKNTRFTLQVASFTDPGFTSPAAGTQETFAATIDWGDGTGPIAGALSVVNGSPGVLTTGTVAGSHTYSSAGDYAATVTVSDDDLGTASAGFTIHVLAHGPNKFFVVDQSAHTTFRYDLAGNPIDQSALANSRPRGTASNLAGDTLWVIDANKNAYVYTAAGTLLGSWTANGLSQPQDITTNGTDIWIVDNAKDRVYRYAKAAGRTSGSQSPDGSFALDPANTHPSGLVTDGKTMWVTDDFNHTDNVFVYSLAGTRLGAWLLDSVNDAPSGITLNPHGGTDLWVVDRQDAIVYRYAGATTRRDGTQAPADSFALADGNHHPEGIADPPPAMPQVAQGFTIRPYATVEKPGALGFAAAGSRYGPDLFVTSGDETEVTNDQILTVSDSGTVRLFATLLPQADPGDLEWPTLPSPFGDFLFV
ncbi:MAG TPA: PKD domain-containing protein, partial [Gemmataceae bacterium]|nr:PKD domain-containing protein [Gemmataceae bacterium]